MVARRAARRGPRGGPSISTRRPPRARLIAGVAALAVALAIARLSLDLRSGGLIFVSGAVAMLALLAVGSALALARPGWIGAALGLLALAYFGHVLLAGESDLATLGVVSVALLLVGELCQWSIDSRLPGAYDASLHRSRAISVALQVSLGIGIVFISSVAAGQSIAPESWVVALAVAATVALVWLISTVAIREGQIGN